MQTNYTVYIHIAPNGKRYIGMTGQDVEQRWRHGLGYKRNQPFYNAIQKYGWDNIKHEIIAFNLSYEEAALLEKELIQKYKTREKNYGYNVCVGGEDGWVGVHHTEEAKRKMSNAKAGKPSSRKGVKLSDETKQKLSESHKGKYRGVPVKPKIDKRIFDKNGKIIFSDEHRRKMSEARKGIKYSKEILENMSKSQIKTKKPVRCIDTMEEFDSETAASKKYGIDKTLIGRACKRINKTAKGLRFEYINKEGNNNV